MQDIYLIFCRLSCIICYKMLCTHVQYSLVRVECQIGFGTRNKKKNHFRLKCCIPPEGAQQTEECNCKSYNTILVAVHKVPYMSCMPKG